MNLEKNTSMTSILDSDLKAIAKSHYSPVLQTQLREAEKKTKKTLVARPLRPVFRASKNFFS